MSLRKESSMEDTETTEFKCLVSGSTCLSPAAGKKSNHWLETAADTEQSIDSKGLRSLRSIHSLFYFRDPMLVLEVNGSRLIFIPA